ncbi:hypothetical protein OG535_39245 [Kitasatospora sp. NBC_00085]|uniref:hypothetical protein n=1 Tax=unclassified Kitasatospora TaxID=2633591 RepID=UPI0032466387
MARIRDLLRGMLPAGLTGWEINIDRDYTRRLAAAQLMGTTYSDLLTVLDDTFLHRRTGGAEELEPRAKLWHEDEKTLVGDYAIWLGQDPSVDYQRWLVLPAARARPRTRRRPDPPYLPPARPLQAREVAEAVRPFLGSPGRDPDHPLTTPLHVELTLTGRPPTATFIRLRGD